MHLRAIAPAIAALLSLALSGTTQAGGHEQPSFDCDVANLSSVERAICNDPLLAWHDRMIDAQYSEIRGRIASSSERNQLGSDQKRWLRLRNACANPALGGGNRSDVATLNSCIAERYTERSIELGENFADFNTVLNGMFSWSKGYEYNDKWVENGGRVAVWMISRDTVGVSISVVMGPTFHMCNYSGNMRLNQNQTLGVSIDDLESEDRLGEGAVVLSLREGGASVEVLTSSPSYHCGARARMDGRYARDL